MMAASSAIAQSINCYVVKYPSLPGVEGAQVHPRVLPRAESHQEQTIGRTQKERKLHTGQRPLNLEIYNSPTLAMPHPTQQPLYAEIKR
jgi:hypothetical protein